MVGQVKDRALRKAARRARVNKAREQQHPYRELQIRLKRLREDGSMSIGSGPKVWR